MLRARLATLLALAGAAAAAAPAGAATVPATPTTALAAGAPASLTVGSQTLKLCGSDPTAYCGRLAVPLDYRAANGPRIGIAYRWYPASAPAGGRAAGTVVPVEGGPGYPSIGSVAYPSAGGEGGYAGMYGPLLERWNMLAVDNRGTGQSTPLECPALQRFSGPSGTAAFQQAAAGCAQALDHRWRYPGGAWVQASDLFTSAYAADDLAAVIGALDLPKVDLYGDSYGSFFAQVFANRFPTLVRSVILDSTYETIGLDPWYRSTIESMPGDFEVACARSVACAAAAAPSGAWERIQRLAARLRSAPISAAVPGPDGRVEQVSMDSVGLVNLLSDSAEDPHIYRELDAADRALLDEGDADPLLRLYAQRLFEDEAYFGLPVHEYSVELYLAVSCLDYPQLFDMGASEPMRAAQLAGAEAALPAATFSPFTIAEWLEQDQNTEAYTACLDWPAPTVSEPPTTGTTPLLGPSLPVLVLGGELDTWTPAAGIPKVLDEIGGHAHFIELANSTHVVGEGDTACGSTLVQEFVADPGALDTLDASCAAAVPPIHTVGVYPSELDGEPPLAPTAGNRAGTAPLRLGAAAVATAGDAIARYTAIEAKLDHGLHGGTVKALDGGSRLTLKGDELIAGVKVSGTVELSAAATPLDGDAVLATLTVHAVGLPRASLQASWTTAGANAQAEVIGSVGREAIAGTTPAP